MSEPACPSCGSEELRVFHEVRGVPVNSVLLMGSRDEALALPRGDIRLAHCGACDFVHNAAFEPELLEYSGRCEETQGHSPTFRDWHESLARRLVERHDLRGKDVIEIGCGKGEFLALLCEIGGNRGLGFDPAYVPERNTSSARDRMEVVRDFYSERYADRRADFVACKMTLEHVPRTLEFVRMVRRSVGDSPDTVVFFQVPDLERILEEVAFWDVYYEHCSYFTGSSLAALFERVGFEVVDVRREYDDQYLTLEARPGGDNSRTAVAPDEADAGSGLAPLISRFEGGYRQTLSRWRERLRDELSRGGRPVIWGSGSKAVAFLCALEMGDGLEHVVDINPYRQGSFMPATGQRIVAPEELPGIQPTLVVVMNPIYREEIEADLRRLELQPEVVTT